MAMRKLLRALPAARFAVPVLILTTWVMLPGMARSLGAQQTASRFGGYMRMVSASGHVISGESTDPIYKGWIPLRQTTMPTAAQMAAMADDNSAASSAPKGVHPPIMIVKDRDSSSLALLAAFSGRQHFPEVDITLTDNSDKASKTYKLTDAVIISIRAAGGGDGTQETVEQLRITYSKIAAQ
jgi:type VI protein secretion system component Hcp